MIPIFSGRFSCYPIFRFVYFWALLCLFWMGIWTAGVKRGVQTVPSPSSWQISGNKIDFFNNLKIFLEKNILKGTLSNLDRKTKNLHFDTFFSRIFHAGIFCGLRFWISLFLWGCTTPQMSVDFIVGIQSISADAWTSWTDQGCLSYGQNSFYYGLKMNSPAGGWSLLRPWIVKLNSLETISLNLLYIFSFKSKFLKNNSLPEKKFSKADL